jgi:hypothetical protein
MYSVYKTVNLTNGKYYIGVHKTDDPNDRYLGSGKLLQTAVKKYGIAGFVKHVLAIFDDPESAFAMEANLVTKEVVASGKCYNMKIGGYGGFDLVNQTKDCSDPIYLQKLSDSAKAHHKRGHPASFKYRHDNRCMGKSIPGWKQTQDAKDRMSETKRKNKVGVGEKNSQAGTMWITNELSNRKINKCDPLPEGWRKGRNM